jgi:hypothetical protein
MGFGLSAFTTLIALWLARRNGVKFWLSSTIHRFRRQNAWPPFDHHKVPPNQAGRVLLTALILVVAPTAITLCIILGIAFGQPGQLAFMAIFLVILCGTPVAILVLRDVLDANFVARTPWECWGAEESLDGETAGPDQGFRSLVTDY